MMTCDLQLLPRQDAPARAEPARPDAGRLQRRVAERAFADLKRTQLCVEATIRTAASKPVQQLAMLGVEDALSHLATVKTDVAARLLLLVHAGRARTAYAHRNGERR